MAEIAKKKGVKNLFASSQSIYGIPKQHDCKDNCIKNPITSYAYNVKLNKSLCKWQTIIFRQDHQQFFIPKDWADIVFNNLLVCVYLKRLNWSDGLWRPVIHIDDVCEAFISCIKSEDEIINKEF